MPYRDITSGSGGFSLGYQLSGLPSGNPSTSTSTDRFYSDMSGVYPVRQFPIIFEEQYSPRPTKEGNYDHFGAVDEGDHLVGGIMFFINSSSLGEATFETGYARIHTGSNYVSEQRTDCSGDNNGSTLQGAGTSNTLGRNEIWNTTKMADDGKTTLRIKPRSIGGAYFRGFYNNCTQSSYSTLNNIGSPYGAGNDYFYDGGSVDGTVVFDLDWSVIENYSTIYLHFENAPATTTSTTTTTTTTTAGPTCKVVSVTSTQVSSTAACTSTTFSNVYFYGAGTYPEVNDYVYGNALACDTQNSSRYVPNGYYQIELEGTWIQVSSGQVINKAICSI